MADLTKVQQINLNEIKSLKMTPLLLKKVGESIDRALDRPDESLKRPTALLFQTEFSKWYDLYKNVKSFEPNIDSMLGKEEKQFFKMLIDFEKEYTDRKRIHKQKKAIIKWKQENEDKKNFSILFKIKALDYAINDSENMTDLKEKKTIYITNKTPKQLTNELFEIYNNENNGLDTKTTDKIFEVVEKYNQAVRKFK